MQFLVLPQEPHVYFCQVMYAAQGNAQLNGVVYNKDPVPAGNLQFMDDFIVIRVSLPVGPQAIPFDFQRLGGFVKRLLEGAADPHNLPYRFHLQPEGPV